MNKCSLCGRSVSDKNAHFGSTCMKNVHIIITIIAITIKASKKVDLEIKNTFYKMPIFTIFLWVPIALISSNII